MSKNRTNHGLKDKEKQLKLSCYGLISYFIFCPSLQSLWLDSYCARWILEPAQKSTGIMSKEEKNDTCTMYLLCTGTPNSSPIRSKSVKESTNET